MLAHEVGGEHIEYGRAAVVYGFQPSVLVPHLTVLEFLRLRLRQLSALIIPQFIPYIRVISVEGADVVRRGLDLRGVEGHPFNTVMYAVIAEVFKNVACLDSVVGGIFGQVIHNARRGHQLLLRMLSVYAAVCVKVMLSGSVSIQHFIGLRFGQFHFKRVLYVRIDIHSVLAVVHKGGLAGGYVYTVAEPHSLIASAACGVKNSKGAVGVVVHYSRRSVGVYHLACTLGILLPVTEPALELLRLRNIFKFCVDKRTGIAYTMNVAIGNAG